MSASITRFEGSIHAQADRLLPWYVNGTLERGERMQVEHHLSECLQCQREVTWLRAMQADFTLQAREDHAWLREWYMRHYPHNAIPSFRKHDARWLASLAVVQTIVIIALCAFVLIWPHAAYFVSGTPNDDGKLMMVTFNPHTSEEQLRRILRTSNARIVNGPTEGDTYVLRVRDADAPEARKALLGSGQVTLVQKPGPDSH